MRSKARKAHRLRKDFTTAWHPVDCKSIAGVATCHARAYLGPRMTQDSPAPPIDILAVLRLALFGWWREFAPIIGLGALLVTLPALAGRLIGPIGGEIGTLVATAQGVCAMLFLSAVGYGVLHVFARRPLAPRRFMAAGLAAAQPGLVVALILGAGLVTVRIIFLIAGALSPIAQGFVDGVATAVTLWAVATLLPAVPAAVAERLGPMAALERAAALTRGNRVRLLGLCCVVALAIVPIAGLVTIIVFGQNASPADAQKLLTTMTAADPALWIMLLSDLLLAGVLACVPASVYAVLVTLRVGR